MIFSPRAKARRGFTLTELAIVLGIVGLILGAIWAAASHLDDANRNRRAVAQIVQIFNNYKVLYAQHGVDVQADITCTGVLANFFPTDTTNPTTCNSGDGTTYPQHPWGNYIQVIGDQTNQGITIVYAGLPRAACSSLANAVFNADNVILQNINNSTLVAPTMTLATIDSLCVAGSGNTVYVEFRGR